LFQDCLHINGIPKHDHVDDESKNAELIFLTLAVALPQFAPFTAENDARDAVATFSAVELRQRAPAHVFVIDVAKRMQGFVNAPEFSDGLRQSSRVVTHLQGTHDAGSRYSALQERAAESEHVIPVRSDTLQLQLVLGNGIELAVVGARIDAPEARAADVCQAWAEAIAQVSEQPET
jgi:hypothetical protein